MTAIERIENAIDRKQKTLDLSGTGIKEIPNEISQLPWLTDLILWNTDVTDLSPLSSLMELRTIHLPKSVKDVSPLAGLPNLKNLDAYHSSVTDFTPFDGRIGLTIHVDMKRVVELRKKQAV